ncbi:MAG: HD-GYP domain-containing protein [Bacteriovoracaceae bacterium]|nr:HD-GYP domain-containing protein [Bacteriovoracaceae bacterium]
MQKKNNVLWMPPANLAMLLVSLANKIEELVEAQKKANEMAARAILHALDCKDHYTFGHSMRVTYYSLVLGKQLGCTPSELYELQLSALFHDIGKIGTPDRILLKEDRLTEEEFQIMKQHPVKSAEILDGFEGFEQISINARHHHERWDGKGYPDNLQGEEIPFFSRVILIADTFDAMTSTRPYREGLSHEVAFQELLDFAGSQFDPAMVPQFIEGMKKEDEKNKETFYISVMGEEFTKKAA